MAGLWMPVAGLWMPVPGLWMPVPGLWMPVLLVLPDIGHVCWASLQYMLGLGWADLVPDRLLLVFLLGPWLLVLGPQLLAFDFLGRRRSISLRFFPFWVLFFKVTVSYLVFMQLLSL